MPVQSNLRGANRDAGPEMGEASRIRFIWKMNLKYVSGWARRAIFGVKRPNPYLSARPRFFFFAIRIKTIAHQKKRVAWSAGQLAWQINACRPMRPRKRSVLDTEFGLQTQDKEITKTRLKRVFVLAKIRYNYEYFRPSHLNESAIFEHTSYFNFLNLAKHLFVAGFLFDRRRFVD